MTGTSPTFMFILAELSFTTLKTLLEICHSEEITSKVTRRTFRHVTRDQVSSYYNSRN